MTSYRPPRGAGTESAGGPCFEPCEPNLARVSCAPADGPHDRRTREMMEKVPMTALGYASLETELKQRQSVDRPRIIEHIAEARSHGDLSENAEYHAAKEEQSHNEGRIAELEDKLARADIIDISKLSGDTVKFGATVTLIDEDIDKKKGATVEVVAPGGAKAYEITKVEWR